MSVMAGDGPRVVVQVDPDLMPLIPNFLAHRRDDVDAIRAALARSDYHAIRVVGHNLRGCGAGYGFVAITDFGTVIEQAALGGDAPAIGRHVDELATYLGRLDVV